jgi:nucleoside-diphosphate-sugar epimerase
LNRTAADSSIIGTDDFFISTKREKAVNILVTGGAGYIGAVLAPRLLEAGHTVTVVDNFMYRQNSLAHVCHYPGFSVIRGDVRSAELMKPLVTRFDAVIPLAGLVGAPACAADPAAATAINRDAVLMMLSALSPHQMVIMPTTNSAYGTGDVNNFCTEESPLRPISQYAGEKVETEKALMDHPGAVSFRLATVFGMSPRMRVDLLVNDFTCRAVTDRFVVLFESSFKRNYIHVRDVARAFLHALQNHAEMKGQVYNVGLSNANISKKELCGYIQKQVPDFVFMEAPVGKDPDQRNYIVSNAKVEATGYTPEYSLDMGIAELIKGYTMIKCMEYRNC